MSEHSKFTQITRSRGRARVLTRRRSKVCGLRSQHTLRRHYTSKQQISKKCDITQHDIA